MAGKLTKIQSQDPSVNRIQDQWMAVLNPILKTLPAGIGDRPTITGSTGGNAALESLLNALESMGVIKDETT